MSSTSLQNSQTLNPSYISSHHFPQINPIVRNLQFNRFGFLHPRSTTLVLRTSRRFFLKATASSQKNVKNDKEIAGSFKKLVAQLFEESLRVTTPEEFYVDPDITPCQYPLLGDYQCNNAMDLYTKLKGKATPFSNSQSLAEAIIKNLPASEMIDSCSVNKGFINVKLSSDWIAQKVQKMLVEGVEIWAPRLSVKRVVVDFSSPNIAKEMHVGHLRSIIMGDTIARSFEFSNVEVLRRNHLGDWGTQIGMLIEFLFEKFPSGELPSDHAIGDLETFYKVSNHRFSNDPDFKKKAQQAVVSLQAGEEKYRKAWAHICEMSRKEYERVYERLGVHLEEKGESFYNPYIPGVLELLDKCGLIEESDGARVIPIEGKKEPLIVVKSDSGYNYGTTDLTALWYRLNVERADWIIYVTDEGQQGHFEKIFTVAKKAGWLPSENDKYPKVTHVPFGCVFGEDKKRIRTRSAETVKLVDFLDEAKTRFKKVLVERVKAGEWTEDELDKTAEAVGYAAVKYSDLTKNRSTPYTFSVDKMLNDKGNNAARLLYTHVRACSIIRTSGKDIQELKKSGRIVLAHANERVLGFHLLQFSEVVENACISLLPNTLCEYLDELSQDFKGFYTNCPVVGSAEETSRLLLCEATSVIMRKCFHLLGITPVYKL